MMTETTLDAMLAASAAAGASDVHLTSEHPPLMRVDGAMVPIPWPPAAIGMAPASRTAPPPNDYEDDCMRTDRNRGR